MRNRLEVAKDLLASDGSIYIQLHYNEVHYGKILMDEIFGEENFQREIIWDTTVLSGYKTIANNWIRGHDSILFYTKTSSFLFNKLHTEHSEKYLARFDQTDADGRKYFGGRGEKRYLDEVIEKGKSIGDVWADIMSFQQIPTAKERLSFAGQKPEQLLRRIIASATNEGDIVLDFFAGTGTTGSVAHKMERQWIMCEQMDYIHDMPEARMKEVVAGDQSGISKEVKWKGGGDFVYAELMPLNQVYMEKVEKAKDEKELTKVWSEIQEKGFLSYKLDLKQFDANAKDFAFLSLADQKRFILESLDYNQLYVNYSEMEDKDYAVPLADKKLNKEFYG
jgi:adenine-specific DNA-methyltransferase